MPLLPVSSSLFRQPLVGFPLSGICVLPQPPFLLHMAERLSFSSVLRNMFVLLSCAISFPPSLLLALTLGTLRELPLGTMIGADDLIEARWLPRHTKAIPLCNLMQAMRQAWQTLYVGQSKSRSFFQVRSLNCFSYLCDLSVDFTADEFPGSGLLPSNGGLPFIRKHVPPISTFYSTLILLLVMSPPTKLVAAACAAPWVGPD